MTLSHPNQTMFDALIAAGLTPRTETDIYNFTSLSVVTSAFSHIEVLYQEGFYQAVFVAWDFTGGTTQDELILEQGVGADKVAAFIAVWIARRAVDQAFHNCLDEGDKGGAREALKTRKVLDQRVEAALTQAVV